MGKASIKYCQRNEENAAALEKTEPRQLIPPCSHCTGFQPIYSCSNKEPDGQSRKKFQEEEQDRDGDKCYDSSLPDAGP
jgi:hypothetical protein